MKNIFLFFFESFQNEWWFFVLLKRACVANHESERKKKKRRKIKKLLSVIVEINTPTQLHYCDGNKNEKNTSSLWWSTVTKKLKKKNTVPVWLFYLPNNPKAKSNNKFFWKKWWCTMCFFHRTYLIWINFFNKSSFIYCLVNDSVDFFYTYTYLLFENEIGEKLRNFLKTICQNKTLWWL